MVDGVTDAMEEWLYWFEYKKAVFTVFLFTLATEIDADTVWEILDQTFDDFVEDEWDEYEEDALSVAEEA